ncbi:R3H domain-containing nucleic acid-binding protein [Vampirovibrio sp.]|uniref:R3H domain-containing nucleic acid-binding protein n=1 Tax=Vampirovibrio sp. TaxID=2717857 RepID=UPI003593EE47
MTLKKPAHASRNFLQPLNSPHVSNPPSVNPVLFEESAIATDLQLLIDILPERLRRAIQAVDLDDLIEIVMDLGRMAEARFSEGNILELGEQQVTLDEIHHVVKHMGYFTSDNRAGIPRTLHRISAMRNRQGDIVGLTCRVGKLVTGTVDPIKDIIESGKSVLLLGRPGVGKTSRLREIAMLLAGESQKRVVIVDTSNEIAGDGDIPHPAVGRARRIQVPHRERQKETMIEAVQNHTPEVIIVDEIGTEDEAMAARTIAERGVILVATAHGHTLENLVKNPMLSDLAGGIQTVTLGDEEAKRRASQKTIQERAKKPTFDICIEIRDRNTLAVYPDVAEAVDHLLRGWTLFPEIRRVDAETGATKVLKTNFEVMPTQMMDPPAGSFNPGDFSEHPRDDSALPVGQEEYRVFVYGVSKSYLDRILERLNMHHIRITKNVYDANAVIAIKANARPGSKILKLAQDYEVPVYYAKTNTMPQIQRALREALDAEVGAFAGQMIQTPFEDEMELALREAQEAVDMALAEKIAIELAPRRSYIRRIQHELVERHHLTSVSIGDEPNRRLKVLPLKNRD